MVFVRPLSEDLQDRIDGIMVPGQAIVLDLAHLTFLDTSAIHCFIRAEAESGHPVVLMNASRAVRRILNLARPDSYAGSLTDTGQLRLRCSQRS
jgi:anti-anti-sigma regulatory factor